MARIRSVKPEFWSDRKLATRVSRDARLLYIALWNFSDEHGRIHGDTRYVKGNCLPYDDDISLTDIDTLLGELESTGRIQRYDVDGDPYLHLPKLAEHQRLEGDKVGSRLPAPPDLSVITPTPPPHADNPAPRADSSAPDADENALLYVAGSRWQVAGGRVLAPTSSTRERDEIWDALMAACDVDTTTVTGSSRGAYNRAVAELRKVNADPTEITRRAENFQRRWPGASLTPTALARRWAECDIGPPPSVAPSDQRVQNALAIARAYEERGE